MDPRLSCGSPREDGELEDGEICDDETEEKQQQQQQQQKKKKPQGARPGTGSRKPKTSTPRSKPTGMGLGKDFRAPPPPFRPGPMLHASFTSCPTGPDRLEPPSPRTSFWERSHGALGRLRYRGRAGEGRVDRARGAGRGRNVHRKDSPNWKQKQGGRAAGRKPAYISPKVENGMDESFEDLLMKYKQIQLELECIRNQERRALKPSEDSPQREQEDTPAAETLATAQGPETNQPEKREEQEERKSFQAFNLRPLRQKLLTPAERDALNTKTTQGVEQKEVGHIEEGEEVRKEAEKSPVQPTTPKEAEEDEEEEESSDLSISLSKEVNKTGKDEDDELSELQLRLLALQSASRRWQQKEQQVMKESKEKLNRVKTTPDHYRVTTRSASAGRGHPGAGVKGLEKGKLPSRPGTERSKAPPKGHAAKHTLSPVSKQAWRKQQLRTWKLQQEAQKQKSEEEEEKKKREEEIRKIRDLSNQEEQYNRFMKLVGGKHHTHTKSSDPEHRKLKQGLDSAGNLYQYDNYDEVAMDTDSETNSPDASPAREPFGAVGAVYAPVSVLSLSSAPLRQDVSQYCVDPVGVVSQTPPPPPPPMPPPEDSERPPKPPFADEEEEEEMMLREELLKSLANKRAVRPEDASSNSGPPSPIRPVAPPTIRAHTAASVSLGFSTSSTHSRTSSKFGRGAGASRAPLVLPRHKAVVIRLNASDDSDSEMEASSSAQCVFGGLESMIKEARRTVEARPRAVPVAEKENNPLRTQDTLPEGAAMEYRLLRAELTSRENRRMGKSDSAASSPVGFDSDVDVLGKPSEISDTEEKLAKHHAQLQKDLALLEQLHQQELRKKESLKLSEAKVMRLKEQLLAAEKVASANRVLLRKLQEQVQRVQHRVAVKQHNALRMERELLSQTGVLRGNYKRSNTQLSMGKRHRVDLSDAHYADLMAQKKRLQQLESEYALKIQKLKEEQALRQANTPIIPCDVTQPSLHDLTQDKLTLASDDPGDDPDPEGVEPQPVNSKTTTTRRRSFRESGSFTKPNLSHTETPVTPTTQTIPTVSTKQATPPTELLGLFGLGVEDLRLRYQQCETLSDLLRLELCAQGGALMDIRPSERVIQVDFDPMAPQQVWSELKPVPFGPYRSPLLVFRSYRFSPYFRTKEKLSLSSITYSHAIEPRKCFCRFDLTGTCNDDDCQWQHMRNCTLNGNQLFQDILSYSLPLIGCSDESSTNDITRATEKYIKKLFGANKDRMGSDQKAVLLVSKVNESLRHVPPFTTHKQRRKWRPEPHRTSPDPNTAAESEEENITIPVAAEEDGCGSDCRSMSDVCVTQDDKRYFDTETDDISNLEYSVLDSPSDRQLWIKLAYRYLNQKDTSAVTECVDAALNTLSRALEDNREDEELWCHYLTLFSRRGSTDDVREMCDMAVEHAAHYTVWWTYLSIESSFDGKDVVCKRLLQFLMDPADGAVEELSSFHLLEALLYRTQLSVFTGRVHNGQHILQDALMSEGVVSSRLTLPHRCVAWLCYIHLCEFGTLPAHLFDPANSNPSRIVSLEHFLFPWKLSEDVHTPPERLVTLFQDALSRCVDNGASPAEWTLACLPLYLNLLHLHKVLGRLKEAIALCVRALEEVPDCCPLLEILSELHVAGGDANEAACVWLRAHRLHPHDARVFYSLCKCLHTQERRVEIDILFQQFVWSLCNGVQEDLLPAVALRHLLGVPSEDLQHSPSLPSLPEQLQDQLPYLHLTHCFWQSVRGSTVEAVEAFEAALGAISDLEVVKKLWLDYLLFTSSKLAGRELRVFSDLVQRCLNTVPSRITLPYHSTTYWSCYNFHNQVISFYLSFLPSLLHSSALERFRTAMPSNTELSLRVLQQEWSDENVEQMKLQSRLMTATVPTCLSAWKIAIAVQKQQTGRSEVQKLYQQALQKLPLCAALWKDWLLFEAAAGGKTDTLNKLVAKCQDVGVSLSEPLSVHSHTQDS
ncbi:zinc finger C3H1 domain-containing protein isoform X1 [Hemibagrus wyckioides]|uniref:zinc finger C3H1 domain-containing protein isoform X1 n=1 Tax=Hemibagrus wyckioides TaxID=337641 RepID=UPI00266C8870|nr:zinc finger C3H1 domain-containing protein isoform X1 [Hemibagrus wyckioides]